MASSAALAMIVSEKTSINPQDLDELALAAIAHTGFQKRRQSTPPDGPVTQNRA